MSAPPFAPSSDEPQHRPSREIDQLLGIMAQLRDPVHGCPWDVAQSFATIAPYTVEEAYEVADAILRGDLADLRDELGDLLLQVVFHARMAEEQGAFAFGDVVASIAAKLVRRHPHVFGPDAAGVRTSRADVDAAWEAIKRAESVARAVERGEAATPASVLGGVPVALPALTRADKLTRKAARVGFSWTEIASVIDKVAEELREVGEVADGPDRAAAEEEVGDLLFTVANLARHLDIDPETALAAANAKFERRFRGVEARLAALGRSPETSSLEEMDRLWGEVKQAERHDRSPDPDDDSA